jgi:tight adherence protein C
VETGSFAANLPSSWWVVLLLIGVGFYGPTLWLRHRIRMRERAVQEGFPDALDMLLVSVEAGLGLDAAIARVASEIRAAHPIIADEFGVVGLEVRAGKSRHAVLRDMAERIGVDEVSSLVTVLNQSNRFGTNVADALRVYASEMRNSRMMRAEERANKLPVKLSIAVVLCMLPAMFAVILGPIVIKVVRVLLPTTLGGS